MSHRPVRVAVALVLAAVCMIISVPAAAAAGTSAAASVPRNGRQLLAWIAAHRSHVALSVTDGTSPVEVNATAHVPLASVYKVLLLVAYGERVAAHTLDPRQRIPLTAVERWYWPGTDGGAHEDAVAYWRSTGALRGSGPDATVSLDDVVTGMIRFSDNSSADYVLQRVGVAAASDVARRHSMRGQYPVEQKFGEFVALSTVPARTWRALSPAARAATSLALARATPVAATARLPFPSIPDQNAWLERGDTQGTAADWMRLWSDIEAGRGISPAADEIVRRHAEWEQEIPVISGAFAHYGYKGGSYATILNVTGYEVTRGGRTVVYALMLHDLTPAFATGVQAAKIDLVQRLALQPSLYRQAVHLLAG